MNYLEQLQNLDTNDIGRWPLVFRVALIIIIFAAVVGGGVYYFVIKDRVPLLERAEAEETTLRGEFERKQGKAANLEAYKEQLAEMRTSFGAMLRQLPGKTEVPNLLVDISQTGLASGLDEKLFQPSNEVRREFYAELPIRIRLTGTYHELGNFVSGIAALPRIVTLHDIKIDVGNENTQNELVMDVTAKTYRYVDEDEEEGS
ncbi:MAG: type 4a pilus biogenesis protein PilO [Pseudomonadota bacterium]